MIARAPRSRPLPVDWGAIAPLRISSRRVSEGYFAGGHRSVRRGAGVEFGGQRPYVPGDDLRFLDRRSLLRHDRLLVREFDTETERGVWLALDASRSMSFRGEAAPCSKFAYAALLAAALARIAIAGQDPVALAWLGEGEGLAGHAPGFGAPQMERVVHTLESVEATLDIAGDPRVFERCCASIARRARRGSVVVVFSDLLDLPPESMTSLAALGAAGRMLVVVEVLDPIERDLGYRGKVRLLSLEGKHEVTTDADLVRAEYVRRLDESSARWQEALSLHGGRLVRATTRDDAVLIVRRVLEAISEARG